MWHACPGSDKNKYIKGEKRRKKENKESKRKQKEKDEEEDVEGGQKIMVTYHMYYSPTCITLPHLSRLLDLSTLSCGTRAQA